jgi:hypothetical protein
MDLADLKSWGKHWNDAAMERIADALPRNSPSRTWPLLGMLALGLVAGAALGGYAMSQRSRMKRFFEYAPRFGDQFADSDMLDEDGPGPVVTTRRSNHRRKATSEV